jgi:hypothetical protein
LGTGARTTGTCAAAMLPTSQPNSNHTNARVISLSGRRKGREFELLYVMDSISYELMNEEPREVWQCEGECGQYRHRRVMPGILPAVHCGEPARLVMRYSQPIPVTIEQEI